MITTASDPAFVAHRRGFEQVLGPCPRLSLLVEVDAHEGPVFWGRPSAYQLWEDLQDLFRRIKPDFDPTVAQVREAWEATAAVPH